mmetsp:Transcript_1093/g.2141  ORF Transcript_1093/g.2141 Transcript_1093/m.2141 type:complete len:151 (-) Transcript_1093:393-845(-)
MQASIFFTLMSSVWGISKTSRDIAVYGISHSFDILQHVATPCTGSQIVRMTKLGIYFNAGRENAVTSIKAFTMKVVTLALITWWFKQQKDKLTGSRTMSSVQVLENALIELFISFRTQHDYPRIHGKTREVYTVSSKAPKQDIQPSLYVQ